MAQALAPRAGCRVAFGIDAISSMKNSPWSAYEELQSAAFQPPIGAGIATERQDVNTLECESDDQDLPD